VLALFTTAACSTAPDSSPTTGSPGVSSPQPSAAPATSGPADQGAGETATSTPATEPSTGTPIRVTVGGQTFTAELYDNPTAHDLVDQLPLTLDMDDHNRLEKTGRLPRELTTDGAPRGSDPEPNEIGYYAPGHDLVLYYGDVGYYTGIVRIGRFRTSIDDIADQPDGVTVTVERA
jgi:hypothetical protein